MQANEIRQKFLKFFEEKGHKVIPSSSLVPENDPSVLFTTAGMQQFKKYYSNPEQAEKDFGSKNVVSIQKCIRTGDIEEVGDNSHLTFFEMLGNFSFGGYGREDAIKYAYEFITEEMGLNISYVTIYEGQGIVPKDEESEEIWKRINKNLEVKKSGSDVFWGPTGDSGPCGPTTEIYCKNASDENVEIWNIVFNEYFCNGSREKLDKGEAQLTKLPILGIDTGMGFERLVSIVQKKKSIYETDLFFDEKTKEERIISDHIKASLFIMSDGVKPSNKGAGYVLRRLMRTVFSYKNVDIDIKNLINKIIGKYESIYPELKKQKIDFEFLIEKSGYEQSYNNTEAVIRKCSGIISGNEIFNISSTFGTRISDIDEIMDRLGKRKTENFKEEFAGAMKEHQELSRTASAGMFKGGLADNSEQTTKYHTATHLLLAALRQSLGSEIYQKGSNITAERLRFDFNYPQKLTEEQIKEIENIVNQKIKEKISVQMLQMPKEEALKTVKVSFDPAKYGEIVKVYKIGDFSAELCGGPHVQNTSELGAFKIQKEEAVSAGVRRIKAVLL